MNLSTFFQAAELEARYAKWARIGLSRQHFMREIGSSIRAAYWFMPSVRI